MSKFSKENPWLYRSIDTTDSPVERISWANVLNGAKGLNVLNYWNARPRAGTIRTLERIVERLNG